MNSAVTDGGVVAGAPWSVAKSIVNTSQISSPTHPIPDICSESLDGSLETSTDPSATARSPGHPESSVGTVVTTEVEVVVVDAAVVAVVVVDVAAFPPQAETTITSAIEARSEILRFLIAS